MSDKRTCPACDSHTSAIYRAFVEGEPCPYCGFPAEAAALFDKAHARGVETEIIARMVEAEKRATEAEKKTTRLQSIVNRVQMALIDDEEA